VDPGAAAQARLNLGVIERVLDLVRPGLGQRTQSHPPVAGRVREGGLKLLLPSESVRPMQTSGLHGADSRRS
jgi:hypothetical protein